MRRTLIVVSFLLLTVGFSVVRAQAELPPLLILNDGGIYAISPEDGTILETLVAPPENYTALADATYEPVTLFSAEWMSPDGEFLAYRVMSERDPIQAGGDPVYTQRFFLLNLLEGGDPIPVTLADENAYRVTVESVAWSNDGVNLYVLVTSQTPRQNDPVWALLIFEREQWQTPLEVPLDAPDYAMGRSIFATDEGAAVWDRGLQSPRYAITNYDTAGEVVSLVEVNADMSPDVNLYINPPVNPLVIDGVTRFGLIHQMWGSLHYQIDLSTGAVTQSEYNYFPALISRFAPDSSVRVSFAMSDGDYASALLRAGDDELPFDYLERVKLHAFGIAGDSQGSTFTLSPDGQVFAYLENGMVVLRRNEASTLLNVAAQVIAWQSPLFTLVYDPAWLAG